MIPAKTAWPQSGHEEHETDPGMGHPRGQKARTFSPLKNLKDRGKLKGLVKIKSLMRLDS